MASPLKRLLRLAAFLALPLVRALPVLDRQAPRLERDIVYGKAGEMPLHLDLYRPREESPAPLPCIVFLHGGGWFTGDKRDPPIRNMARRGFAVASVNYRLSDEAPFPAAIEDSKCAVRFLRANAARYGIDPERIGLMGGSAGGHLALMAAFVSSSTFEGTGGHEETSSAVRCCCAWFPATDFTLGLGGCKGEVERFLGGPLERDLALRASPIAYATKDAPPVLLIHGDHDTDVPFEQSRVLQTKLAELGVSSELVVVENAEHSFKAVKGLPEPSPSYREILRLTEAFFARHLAR
jgi:acetyl esterase/lipase